MGKTQNPSSTAREIENGELDEEEMLIALLFIAGRGRERERGRRAAGVSCARV